MEYITTLIGKKIAVDHYFYGLIELGWKYDLEESDLFVRLSKTYWSEGVKVSLRLDEFCCIPPTAEITQIKELRFYSFDVADFPNRNIASLFLDMNKNPYNTWESLTAYVAHLEKYYPFYLPNADFNRNWA